MTDFDERLAELWGPAAQHSEYRRGDDIRYHVGSQQYTGTIVWVAAPRESAIEGHGMLPTRYIVERTNWEGFPDVLHQADIDALEGPQEPLIR